MDNTTGEILNLKEYYKGIMKHSIDDKIFCHCIFEFKDELKKLGFTFNPVYGLWCIDKELFTKDLLDKCLKVRYNTKGIYYYFVYFQTKENIEKAKIKKDEYEEEKKKANPNYKKKNVIEKRIENRNLFL